jgi:peptidoglycan/xylan/chitin deacetylase (PgdA/CDA1 family)
MFSLSHLRLFTTICMGLVVCQSLCAWQHINAFVYHRFGDDQHPTTNIDIDLFETQLKFLAANNYKTLTMSEALQVLDEENDTNEKFVLITIDDAFKSFYTNALPLLSKYEMSATLFVNTETIGAPSYMTWKEIEETAAAGIEIGNHSHAHYFFLNEDIDLFEVDLKTSQKLFKQKMGKAPEVYAYPYGEWNQDMADLLKANGIKGAAAQNSGIIHRTANRYALPRFPMNNVYGTLNRFKEKLTVKAFEEMESAFNTAGNASIPYAHLTIWLPKSIFSQSNIQGFVSGQSAERQVTSAGDQWVIHLWSRNELEQRRTLFTITAMDNEGQWHWYSYQFVQPEIKEE